MAITIHRARKVVSLCTDMSLVAEHEDALKQLATAETEAAGMEVNPARLTAARAVKEAESKMLASSLRFTLQALPRKDFEAFKIANPPRPGDQTDANLGFSQAALDDLIAPCIIEVRDHEGEPVEFDPAKDWTPLADEMSEAQFTPFATTAYMLNAGVGDVPF